MNQLQQKISSLVQVSLNTKQDFALDYFSWGRDGRHVVDNTEKIPVPHTEKK
jgi:hypothetical protein